MREDYQNCSVLYCVLKLCTVISTLSWAVLTVLWIGFCHTVPILLSVDLFAFICVYFVCFCFILHSCCVILSTVGWTWWDWTLILSTYLSSVLWYCWLGHLTRKTRPRYDLSCVWWDVKPCSVYLSIWSSSHRFTIHLLDQTISLVLQICANKFSFHSVAMFTRFVFYSTRRTRFLATIGNQKEPCLMKFERKMKIVPITDACFRSVSILNSTQLNFIVTYLQLNSWTAGLPDVAK